MLPVRSTWTNHTLNQNWGKLKTLTHTHTKHNHTLISLPTLGVPLHFPSSTNQAKSTLQPSSTLHIACKPKHWIPRYSTSRGFGTQLGQPSPASFWPLPKMSMNKKGKAVALNQPTWSLGHHYRLLCFVIFHIHKTGFVFFFFASLPIDWLIMAFNAPTLHRRGMP